MSLLEQDITKKGQVDNKALPEPENNLAFTVKGSKKYEVKAIIDSVVYDQQVNSNEIPGLYYFIL